MRRVYRRDEQSDEGIEGVDPGEEEATIARISLDRLLARLTPAQVAAIEAVKLEGLSIREAAARTGQSEPGVKVNIHRGLRKLAALVEEAE